MELTETDVQYIRLLITDTAIVDEDQIFTDSEVNAVASHERTLKRAAARLLEIMAVSEVLVAKKIRTQDLQTDGPAVAAELRNLAARLRQESDDDEADDYPALVVEPMQYGHCRPELTEPYVHWPF